MPKLSNIASIVGLISLTSPSLSNLNCRKEVRFSTHPECPDGNGQQYVSPDGEVFQLYCDADFDTTKGTVMQLTSNEVGDLTSCMNNCGSTPDCQAFAVGQKNGCRMFTNLTDTGSNLISPTPPTSSNDSVGLLFSSSVESTPFIAADQEGSNFPAQPLTGFGNSCSPIAVNCPTGSEPSVDSATGATVCTTAGFPNGAPAGVVGTPLGSDGQYSTPGDCYTACMNANQGYSASVLSTFSGQCTCYTVDACSVSQITLQSTYGEYYQSPTGPCCSSGPPASAKSSSSGVIEERLPRDVALVEPASESPSLAVPSSKAPSPSKSSPEVTGHGVAPSKTGNQFGGNANIPNLGSNLPGPPSGAVALPADQGGAFPAMPSLNLPGFSNDFFSEENQVNYND